MRFRSLFIPLFALLCIAACFGSEKKRVLVGSPIRQKPAILKEFLASLQRLEQTRCTLEYVWIDDNVDALSSDLLKGFQKGCLTKCEILTLESVKMPDAYVCDERTHKWTHALMAKVGAMKDCIIAKAKQEGYDYLFLVDSDIVLHPHTIEQLIEANKEIVSNIFWTRWEPNNVEMPQVWLYDFYTQYAHRWGEEVSQEEQQRRTLAFYDLLRIPGVYAVGGLGACTLISKEALGLGVKFERVPNLMLWGEDRHFCVRAQVLGLSLFVDTHLPAFHIYRESDLARLPYFKSRPAEDGVPKSPRITLSMTLRNEADRYLRRVLGSVKGLIADAVLIDDASTDRSVEIIEEELKEIPHTIIRNSESKFANEVLLRKQQWEETVKTNPDWILNLDADEVLEEGVQESIQELVATTMSDAISFRLFDMWDEMRYRDDTAWSAHFRQWPLLIRYKKGLAYTWKESVQHCGRFPLEVQQFLALPTLMRIKHFGWARASDRAAKYERYKKLDPGFSIGWKAQYDSILDQNPNLVAFLE